MSNSELISINNDLIANMKTDKTGFNNSAQDSPKERQKFGQEKRKIKHTVQRTLLAGRLGKIFMQKQFGLA